MPSKITTATDHSNLALNADGNYLFVTATGTLYYTGPTQVSTVTSSAAGTSIINLGSIIGLVAGFCAVKFLSTGAPSSGTVQNSGLISGSGIALGLDGATAAITNDGTISGGTSGIEAAAGAVSLANSGIVSGGQYAIRALAGGQLDIANSGDISVATLGTAILGAELDDSLVNAGRILGGVSLGGGDDLYDGRAGLVSGQVLGGDGRDTLYGGVQGETLIGGAGADEIAGFAGNDIIRGGAGGDFLDGGDGFDLVDFGDATAPVKVDLQNETLNEGEAALDAFDRFEGVIGSAFADTLYGDNTANELRGGAGNDVLDGRTGTDTLRGGAGDDLIYVDNLRDRVLEGEGGGADTVIASLTYRLPGAAEIELLATPDSAALTAINFNGSSTANVISGNAGVNRLLGLDGADTLLGLGGNDVLFGGDGNDSLLGGDGNDTLSGEAGDDTLLGEAGNDVIQGQGGTNLLTGGPGNDIFVFDAAGFAVITDYNGPEDTIRLPQALVPGLALGALAGSAFSATAAGVNANTRIYLDVTGGGPAERSINYDPDGSGPQSASWIGTVQNGATAGIANNDFVVIA